MLRRLASLTVAGAVAALGAADGLLAGPRHVATTPSPIHELAQSGDRVAWISGPYETAPCRVKSRRLGSRTTVAVRNVCRSGEKSLHALALAGRDAVWFEGTDDLEERANGEPEEMASFAAPVGAGRARVLGSFAGHEPLHAASAGDGSSFVYGAAHASQVNFDACRATPPPEPCRWTARGALFRWTRGTRPRRLPGGPVVAIALSGGRYATVPAASTQTELSTTDLLPARRAEVRRLRDGALVARVATEGRAEAVALAGRLLALVVVSDDGERRIERYDATTGRLRASVSVPPQTAPLLAAGAGSVVYAVGAELRRLDRNGGTARLARGARAPVALAMAGRRMVWAVNGADERGRVFSLTLPRSRR